MYESKRTGYDNQTLTLAQNANSIPKRPATIPAPVPTLGTVRPATAAPLVLELVAELVVVDDETLPVGLLVVVLIFVDDPPLLDVDDPPPVVDDEPMEDEGLEDEMPETLIADHVAPVLGFV